MRNLNSITEIYEGIYILVLAGFQVLLFRSLPTCFLLFLRKLLFSYCFAIKCHNIFSFKIKLGLLESTPFTHWGPVWLSEPRLIKLSESICSFHLFSLSLTTFKKIRDAICYFTCPQASYFFAISFLHFPTFLLLLYL